MKIPANGFTHAGKFHLGQVILVGSNMIYLLEQVDEPGAGQGNGICQMIQGQTFC